MLLRRIIEYLKAQRWTAALLAFALSACSSVSLADDEADLLLLQDVWVAAEIAGDAQTLERIFDERFLSNWASGKTVDRDEYIDVIISADIAPFTVITDEVVVHGDTGLVISRTEDGGTKFTWIAVKRDGVWRVISQTLSSVESPD
jgi:hypothetical protein